MFNFLLYLQNSVLCFFFLLAGQIVQRNVGTNSTHTWNKFHVWVEDAHKQSETRIRAVCCCHLVWTGSAHIQHGSRLWCIKFLFCLSFAMECRGCPIKAKDDSGSLGRVQFFKHEVLGMMAGGIYVNRPNLSQTAPTILFQSAAPVTTTNCSTQRLGKKLDLSFMISVKLILNNFHWLCDIWVKQGSLLTPAGGRCQPGAEFTITSAPHQSRSHWEIQTAPLHLFRLNLYKNVLKTSLKRCWQAAGFTVSADT